MLVDEACDARERDIHDEITRMRGYREEGRDEANKKMIKAMRKNGFTDEKIKKLTAVDPSELDWRGCL